MAQPDVSIVLALHREAPYVARTWASLVDAARFAAAAGVTVELIAVLDRCDDATRTALLSCDASHFAAMKMLVVNNGSLGPSRNDGIAAATGRWIATADADDLISFNYILALFEAAERAGPDTIVIPNFLCAFGATYHRVEYFGLSEVTPLGLFADHPFLSRICFHNSARARLRYRDTSLKTAGYAFEDWHFLCEAVALGFDIQVAPRTILFYRQRADSLLTLSKEGSFRQLPPSRLFDPPTWTRICAPYVRRLEASGDAARPAVRRIGPDFLADCAMSEMVCAANAIDPAVDPVRIAASHFFDYLDRPAAVPLAYFRLCEIVGEAQFDEAFLLPFLTRGGADRYLLDIMHELVALRPDTRFLILFGQPFDKFAWLDELPAGTVHLDVPKLCPELDPAEQDLVCFRLLQSTALKARLHIKSSEFSHRLFSRYARILSWNRPVYYRFSDGRNWFGDLALIEPAAFQFVSEHLEQLDLIVCDNEAIARSDHERLRVMPEKWRVLPSRIELADLPDTTAADGRPLPRTLLWVSRIDREKRPTLLLEIARLLAQRLPDLTIEVFGQATLGAFDVQRFSEHPNLRYHGAFGTLEDVRPGEHLCFVYTSAFDGVPVVLLEVIAAGLPVIAPAVGGIPEVIVNEETGLLLQCSGDDTADAHLYVEAIERMNADPALLQRLRRNAWTRIAARHGYAQYAANFTRIFATPPTDIEDAA